MFKETTWLLLLKDTGVKIWWWQGQLFSLPACSLVFPQMCSCSCDCWANSHVRAVASQRGALWWASHRGRGGAWGSKRAEEPGVEGSAGDAVASSTQRQISGTSRVNFACYKEANFKWNGSVIAVYFFHLKTHFQWKQGWVSLSTDVETSTLMYWYPFMKYTSFPWRKDWSDLLKIFVSVTATLN